MACRKPLIVTCSKDQTIRVWNYLTKGMELAKKFREELFRYFSTFTLITFNTRCNSSPRWLNRIYDWSEISQKSWRLLNGISKSCPNKNNFQLTLINLAFSHHQQWRLDFNTANFLINPCRGINDEENARAHQNSGGIGKSIPSVLEISLDPREISWASGMDFPIPPEFWWNTDTL